MSDHQKQATVLLSFDLEEFDLPLEYGYVISLSDQIAITTEGLQVLSETLTKYAIKATFYTTARYAIHQHGWVKKLIQDGHELASHGIHHSEFNRNDYAVSREILENQFQVPIYGFRMPRMKQTDINALGEAGYMYHSSLHPTWIPGRYCHLWKSRKVTSQQHILHIPPSVTPRLRIPLFWLSFHLIPFGRYIALCRQTIQADNYLHLYFHPWEWASWPKKLIKHLPFYLRVQSGRNMKQRFELWIEEISQTTLNFTTTYSWLKQNYWKNENLPDKIQPDKNLYRRTF